MKKFIAVFLITLSLLIFVLTQARAEGKKEREENEHSPLRIQSTITPTPETRIIKEKGENIMIQIKVNGIGKDHPKWKGFEMRGTISNLQASSFNLNGKTINMDPNITGKVQINGKLIDDAFVKVEGKIVDEKSYYAKEIKVEKGGEKEDENETDNDDETISPTPTPEISGTPTPSATPTGSVEKSGNLYKINVAGPLEEVIKALESLLTQLKSLI